MTRGAGGEEGFFWDTHPWVMSEKSGSGSAESGSEESKKQLVDSISIENNNNNNNNNNSQMNQPVEMGPIDGSTGGAQETVATITTTTMGGDGVGGSKRNNGDAFKTENVDDMKVMINGGEDKGKGGVEASEHDMHIWTERERRKKMRNMFHQLHALLPQLSPKADKSTIVDEAVNHIKTLQETLKNLQTKKRERFPGLSTNNTRESFIANFGMVSPHNSASFSFPLRSPPLFQTFTSSNVTLNVCGLDAHFSICSPKKPGLLTTICFVLEKHKLEIVSAQISSDEIKTLFMIHAHANAREFVESFPYDELYKQAAAEVMLWVTAKAS